MTTYNLSAETRLTDSLERALVREAFYNQSSGGLLSVLKSAVLWLKGVHA